MEEVTVKGVTVEGADLERLNVNELVQDGGGWKGAKAAFGRGCGLEVYSWCSSLGHG